MSDTDSSNDSIESRVLDAASELFVRFGYDKTTMNDIAREAGVAKSTIYLRWKKKEDLFEALLMRESHRAIDEWFTRVDEDPRGGTIAAWLRHGMEASFENGFIMALYKQDRRILGRMIQERGEANLYSERYQLFVQIFKDLQAVNAVRKDLDVASLSYLMNAINFGLIHFDEVLPEEHTPPVGAMWNTLLEMVERTTMPDDGGNPEAGKRILQGYMNNIRQMLDSFNTGEK